MKKKLDLIDLSSAEIDLTSWKPLSNEDVFICLDIEISFSNEEGTNLFYVTLATPEALSKHCEGPILVKNRTIIVVEYNYDEVKNCILEILDQCSRATWSDSCSILQRYFQWEYEDYSIEV